MIEYVYDDEETERLTNWAKAMLGQGHRLRPDAKVIAKEVNGEIRGVVVFDTFSDNDCLMTVIGTPGTPWLTREFIIRAMAYPFLQLGFPRISCLVSKNNKASLRFVKHFGCWKLEGVLRKGGRDGEDLLLYGMLNEDCRWITLPMRSMAV